MPDPDLPALTASGREFSRRFRHSFTVKRVVRQLRASTPMLSIIALLYVVFAVVGLALRYVLPSFPLAVLVVQLLVVGQLFRFVLRVSTFPGSLSFTRRMIENQIKAQSLQSLHCHVSQLKLFLEALDVGVPNEELRIGSLCTTLQTLSVLHRSVIHMDLAVKMDELISVRGRGTSGSTELFNTIGLILRMVDSLDVQVKPELAATLSLPSVTPIAKTSGAHLTLFGLFKRLEVLRQRREAPPDLAVMNGLSVGPGAVGVALDVVSDLEAALRMRDANGKDAGVNVAPLGSLRLLSSEMVVNRSSLRFFLRAGDPRVLLEAHLTPPSDVRPLVMRAAVAALHHFGNVGSPCVSVLLSVIST